MRYLRFKLETDYKYVGESPKAVVNIRKKNTD